MFTGHWIKEVISAKISVYVNFHGLQAGYKKFIDPIKLHPFFPLLNPSVKCHCFSFYLSHQRVFSFHSAKKKFLRENTCFDDPSTDSLQLHNTTVVIEFDSDIIYCFLFIHLTSIISLLSISSHLTYYAIIIFYSFALEKQ